LERGCFTRRGRKTCLLPGKKRGNCGREGGRQAFEPKEKPSGEKRENPNSEKEVPSALFHPWGNRTGEGRAYYHNIRSRLTWVDRRERAFFPKGKKPGKKKKKADRSRGQAATRRGARGKNYPGRSKGKKKKKNEKNLRGKGGKSFLGKKGRG